MFYNRLESICFEQGMTVSQACVKAGLHRSSGHSWKKGLTPTVTSVCKLAAVLNVTPSYLLHGGEQQVESTADSACLIDSYTRELILVVAKLNRVNRVEVMKQAKELLGKQERHFKYTV